MEKRFQPQDKLELWYDFELLWCVCVSCGGVALRLSLFVPHYYPAETRAASRM